MYPTIKEGETIIALVTKNIAKNDIAIYSKDGKTISHRVLEIKESYLITGRDSQSEPDPYVVGQDEIIGKAVFIIDRYGNTRSADSKTVVQNKIMKKQILRLINIISAYRFYNLICDQLTPFVYLSVNTSPSLNFKRELFFINSTFQLPKKCINFWLLGLPLASVIIFDNAEPKRYIRSLFLNSKRLNKFIDTKIKKSQVTH